MIFIYYLFRLLRDQITISPGGIVFLKKTGYIKNPFNTKKLSRSGLKYFFFISFLFNYLYSRTYLCNKKHLSNLVIISLFDVNIKQPEAELKEFEPQLKFKLINSI